MQKPTLQTILISVLIIVALFTSIYFPYKFKQLSNDFLDQTSHYGELLKQINDLQKEVRELRNGEEVKNELSKLEQVTIATDKIEYKQWEIVKVTIKNNLDEKISFAINCPGFYLNIQKFSDNKWEQLRVSSNDCERNLSSRIDPHISKNYDWTQRAYVNYIKSGPNSLKQVPLGKYRVMINIGEKFGGEIYSNEFMIKENQN